MTTIILALVLASLYALVFYLFFGHGWLRLIFYWIVSIAGFWIGHTLANLIGLSLFNIGALNFAEGSIASVLTLIIARAWQR